MNDAKKKTAKLDRIVEARMKLRARHRERMESSPALADKNALGSGPTNRHGMRQLPPGQTETTKWPVLDLGVRPSISTRAWCLTIDGACSNPLSLDWNHFKELEQVADTSDFHCVTTWSRMNMSWVGVRLADLLALAEPAEGADYLMCYGYDGYETNLPIHEALKSDVLVVHTANDQPLASEHGGPARVITPQLYAWKGAKWIKRIELMETDRPGFWEERGYSNSAHPWRNDRYS